MSVCLFVLWGRSGFYFIILHYLFFLVTFKFSISLYCSHCISSQYPVLFPPFSQVGFCLGQIERVPGPGLMPRSLLFNEQPWPQIIVNWLARSNWYFQILQLVVWITNSFSIVKFMKNTSGCHNREKNKKYLFRTSPTSDSVNSFELNNVFNWTKSSLFVPQWTKKAKTQIAIFKWR